MSRRVLTAEPGSHPESRATLLEVVDLTTRFRTERGTVHAVDGVSFTLDRGRTLGVVGESGSGKTVLSRSVMGLLPARNVERGGHVFYEGTDIIGYDQKRMSDVWGAEMGDGLPGPHDLAQPGDEDRQADHRVAAPPPRRSTRRRREATAVALLSSVGIPAAERRLNEYPHQLSGGMRQRVTIAIALACGPKVLFADEPTTALDVTVQAQILDLLAEQQRERHMAMILVSHDLGVVAGRTDEIMVMYGGRVVEHAPTSVLFGDVKMPYTEALLRSIPRIESPQPRPARGDPRAAAAADLAAEGLQLRAPLPLRAAPVPRGGPAPGGRRRPGPPLPLLVPRRHPRRRRGAGPQPGRRRHRRPPHLDVGDGHRPGAVHRPDR